jgi:hypothetical protein
MLNGVEVTPKKEKLPWGVKHNNIVWTPLRHTKLLIVTGAAHATAGTQTSGQRGADMLSDRKMES